jgi:hypothetical protein
LMLNVCISVLRRWRHGSDDAVQGVSQGALA